MNRLDYYGWLNLNVNNKLRCLIVQAYFELKSNSQDMRQRHMRPRDDQITASFGMVRNPNKSLAWSSISSNNPHPQQLISPLDYKVSNPSSSLVMSSLSNIYEHYQQQKDIQTKQSDQYQFNSGKNAASFGENQYKKRRGGSEQEMNRNDYNMESDVNNEFYKYLMSKGYNLGDKSINNRQLIQLREYKLPVQFHPQNTSLTSMQQSLLHLQHSQQQLSYLKQKLQQAYEKLQKEILHSYDLQQRIQVLQQELNRQQQESMQNKVQLSQELEKKEGLLMLQKRENEKLKFTLKTIIKNQSLREQLSICENQSNLQNNSITSSALSPTSVNDSLLRENELKESLKMRLQLKEQQNVINKLKQTIQQLRSQNTRHSSQTKSKDKYLSQVMQQVESLQQQLQQAKRQLQEMAKSVNINKNEQHKHQQQIEALVNQKKTLLLRQSQLTNKMYITILEQELRIVTDQKVTLMTRLKHQIALLQGQMQQLLQQNQAIKAINQQHFIDKQQSLQNQINTNKNTDSLDYIAYSPNNISKNYHHYNKYTNKLTINKEPNIVENYHQAPLVFDSQEEAGHNITSLNHKGKNHSQTKIPLYKRHRNFNPSDYQNKTQKYSQITTIHPQQNKENLMNNNNNASQQQESESYQQNELSKLQKSVGKWKRSHSQSVSNNSSVYFEGNSNNSQSHNDPHHQQQQQSFYQEIGQKQLQMNMPLNECATQKLIHSKLSLQPPQSQDQKLSKYQQHRKNLETELQSLQKIKRPTKQERQRIQKLQKQLYYVDSDIAGLKRKIRRKY